MDRLQDETAMSPSGPLYLEDLSAGQTFRTASASMTLERIKAFAEEFDPQPFHIDEAVAASAFFGGLVASGWHTAALAMRLLVTSDFKIAGGLIGAGVEEIRWPRPVRPGDILHVEGEVLEVRPSQKHPDRGIVRLRTIALNQNGETVMEQTARLIVPCAPERNNHQD
jgi:acyl dehydratase